MEDNDTDARDDAQDAVVYRCWCEHPGCDWSITIEADHEIDAQEVSDSARFAHGVDVNHYSTREERVDD